METLLQMCLQGSAMIAVVLVLRAALHDRLPKAAFLVLWGVVLARLLLPVSIPVPFNAWSLVMHGAQAAGVMPVSAETSGQDAGQDALAADGSGAAASTSPQAGTVSMAATGPSAAEGAAAASTAATGTASMAADASADLGAAVSGAAAGTSAASGLHRAAGLVWLAGTAASLAALAGLYAYHARRLSDAVELDSRATRQWLSAHPLRRRLRIKESARIASPMTRGVLRPTILVPPGFDWEDPSKSALVLEHEFVHVARFDILYKALLTTAACLFWFNPLVWVLYACANHDIELACDEAVARRLNGHGRSLYAHALVDMVERRVAPMPASTGFGRCAVGRRIAALARIRPASFAASIATALIAVTVAAAFATEATPPAGVSSSESPDASGSTATPTVSDQTAPATRLVSISREDDWATGPITWLRTPHYTLQLHRGMFPDGFDWSFSEAGGEALPAGATEVVTITDAGTGEVVLMAWCYPRANGSPGELPGYVLLTEGTCSSDISLGIVLAIPEGRYDGEGGFADIAEAIQPTVGITGLYGMVQGLPDYYGTTLVQDASREAYIAYAVQEEGGTRIVTPYFSLVIPTEYGSANAQISFNTYGSMGELRPQLYVTLPNGDTFYVEAAYEMPALQDEYTVQLATSVAASNGMQVYVRTYVEFERDYYGQWTRLDTETQDMVARCASWVQPAEADAPADQFSRTPSSTVQSGSVAGTAPGGASETASTEESELRNDLVAVVAIDGGTRLVTTSYQVDIPSFMTTGELSWNFSQGWRSPAPAGMEDVLVLSDGATGDTACIVYRCPTESYANALAAMPGYVQYEVGSCIDGSLLVLALPESRAVDEEVLGQGFAAGCPDVFSRGTSSSVYGLPGSMTANESVNGVGTVVVAASQDAYGAHAVEEEGGTRIVTPHYSVLVPVGYEITSASYMEGPLGLHDIVGQLSVWFSDGTNLCVECCADTDSWGAPNADQYLQLGNGARTSDGLLVAVYSSGAFSAAEAQAANEMHAAWIELG